VNPAGSPRRESASPRDRDLATSDDWRLRDCREMLLNTVLAAERFDYQRDVDREMLRKVKAFRGHEFSLSLSLFLCLETELPRVPSKGIANSNQSSLKRVKVAVDPRITEETKTGSSRGAPLSIQIAGILLANASDGGLEDSPGREAFINYTEIPKTAR